MKLNKIFAAGLCVALALSLAACGGSSSTASSAASSEAASSSAVVEEVTKTYTIQNVTGEDVTELYVYVAGSADKGDNLAGEGLADGATVDVDVTGYPEGDNKTNYVLEYVMGGETFAFETLHVEDLPGNLYLIDAEAVATPISFLPVEVSKTYTIENATGETVTELYVYVAGSEDKGDNIAGEGLADGATVDVTVTGYAESDNKTNYVLEYVMGGETFAFETLHVEDLPGNLFLVDAEAGATPISFLPVEG